MNIYNDAGELLFGTRLKKLSERFLLNMTRIYKTLDIPFEPAWFPLFYILYKYGPKSVTEIAEILDITHSAVSQQATILERKSLVHFVPSKTDKRKRLLNFTKEGNVLLQQILPVWQSIRRNMQRLLAANPNSANILAGLSELEETNTKDDIFTRVLQDLRERHFTIMDILPYSKEHEKDYRNLIFDWLILNENSEFFDVDFINFPDEIHAKQLGEIKLASPDNDIAGTIVLKYLSASEAEILFLIVKNEWQQRQIGRILVMDALKSLREKGFTSVHTQFDRKHIAAQKVFRSCGFELAEMRHGLDKNQSHKTILHLLLNLKNKHEDTAQNVSLRH